MIAVAELPELSLKIIRGGVAVIGLLQTYAVSRQITRPLPSDCRLSWAKSFRMLTRYRWNADVIPAITLQTREASGTGADSRMWQAAQ